MSLNSQNNGLTQHDRNSSWGDMNRALEAVRGLAAFLVVLSHCRLFSYREAQIPITGRSLPEKLLLIPTSFGRESVATFFVLSGYLVGGQVVRQLRSHRFDAVTFLIKRLSRFWVVLLPGLAFTAALDRVSRALFSTDVPFHQGLGRSGFGTLMCNVALLMDNRCQPYGTDDSLWSLGYEFWFYLVFAAAGVAVFAAARRTWGLAAIAAVALLACVSIYGPYLLWLIPAWLMGVAIAEIQSRFGARIHALPHARTLVSTGILFLLGLAVSVPIDNLVPKYVLLGFTTSPLILVLGTFDPAVRVVRPFERAAVWLGTWSFTLYVFHLPLVTFMAVGMANLGIAATPLLVYVLATVTVALVYPCYWLGEAYTPSVRNYLMAKVGRSVAAA